MAGWGARGWVRRWAPTLALLVLAFGPALALLYRQPPPPQSTLAPVEPKAESRSEPVSPSAEEVATAAPGPASEPDAPHAPPAPTAPPPSGGARPRPPERWAGNPACPRDRRSTREYNRCLYDFTRTSEQELEAELANALAVVDARTDLPAVQRTKWRNLLDEAQSRFLLFRNFDCQSVAPFEGPRGIGNFEQRALCLIEANSRRSRELRARYGSPLSFQPEAKSGPWIRGGTFVLLVPLRLE